MPLYDYACDTCGYRFEARQSFADEPLTVCPECTGHVRRVIHPSGIIFKGSGWYITDSRKPESSDSSGSTSSSSDSASKTSESTSDVKTETKAAAADG
jgi:putative FmdB family regulatory protein